MISKKKVLKYILFLLITTHIVHADLCNTTDTDDCLTCCTGQVGTMTCISDILKCPLNPSPDFRVLVTILIIIGGFIIGIVIFIEYEYQSNLFNPLRIIVLEYLECL